MLKHIFIFLILLILFLLIAYLNSSKAKFIEPEPSLNLNLNSLDPNQVVFVFDLHNVLIRPKKREIFKEIWNKFPKPLIISLIFNPIALYYLFKVIDNVELTEQDYDILSKKFQTLKKFKSFFIEFMSSFKINYKMVTFIEELKRLGFGIFVGSNIWPEAYKNLEKKFPDFLNLFNGYYLPSESNGYAAKPNKEYFEGLQKYLDSKGYEDKKVIFIDNNIENIKAANDYGFEGVLFKNAKKLYKKFSCLMLYY